jgi:membrane peptidoglycan carboxypeptidase
MNGWIKALLIFLTLALCLVGGAGAGAVAYYNSVTWPSLNSFGSVRFENTQIMSSNRQLLYEMVDPYRGSRIIKPLELDQNNRKQCPNGSQTTKEPVWYTCSGLGIPKVLRDATIATEDPTFYSNPGFDALSMARALVQDVTAGQVQSGASTITQQYVKQFILHDSSPSATRKINEIILAYDLTKKYPKDEILWNYLNTVYYGHLAYGVQAASQIYFHVGVAHLRLWQAAMLAGMPQSPSNYDPFNNPGPNGVWFSRTQQVLAYMRQRGYITHKAETQAEYAAQRYTFYQTSSSMQYPDFVRYATGQFQQMTDASNNNPNFDPYLVKHLHGLTLNDGLRIITTLNPTLQDQAQQIVTTDVSRLSADNVSDGALVSMNVQPWCYGCIMAMVGTANIDKHTNQVNMAVSPRQPGSSFKVFNYVSAFEKGLSDGSIVNDEPINIPDVSSPTGYYSPTNYDLTYKGPVTVREALANSLNVPAVKVELWNGVRSVARTAHKFGITDLWRDNPHCCGYATTLGGMERGVKLVQETAAYGGFATDGIKVPPISFTQIVDRVNGKVLWQAAKDPYLTYKKRVAPTADAYMITSILKDEQARQMEFGANSPLLLSHEAAVKTGTTNDYKDNWTVGYTPQIVTGVWVGNADRTQMKNINGVTGAAPIWHDFMEQAFQTLNLPDVPFTQPSSLLSGSQCRLADVNYFATSYMSDTTNGTPIYSGPSDPYCTVPAVNGLDNPTTPGSNTQPTQPQQNQQQPQQQPQPQPQPTQAPILPSNQQNQQQPSQQPAQSPPSNNNNAPPPILPGGTQ